MNFNDKIREILNDILDKIAIFNNGDISVEETLVELKEKKIVDFEFLERLFNVSPENEDILQAIKILIESKYYDYRFPWG